MPRISAYIIAYNEAEKIADAVRSVAWADEVIVADSHSTDGTIEIAESLGARVVQVSFDGFGKLRNSALAACNGDWIFSLDSDERCTPEAAREIQALVGQAGPNSPQVYWTPRRNFFLGREIKHSGWYPNYRQPQLFRRGAMSYDFNPVHEGYVLAEPDRAIGHMKQAIWQLPYRNLAELIHKMNRYSTLGAAKPRQQGSTLTKAFGHGLWAFLRHYVFKFGVLDGWAGFVIAFGYFEVTFYRYAKAYELAHADAWGAAWKDIVRR
jgi:glycosyltransferase involved in cell wall biosynthesis